MAVGKVLIIDEAYMLNPGYLVQNRNLNMTTVLDTIVSEVQGYPGEDRCILLLGYPNPMLSLFQNGNPGLSGRFMADRPYLFHDFTMEELREIMQMHSRQRILYMAKLQSTQPWESWPEQKARNTSAMDARSRTWSRQLFRVIWQDSGAWDSTRRTRIACLRLRTLIPASAQEKA